MQNVLSFFHKTNNHVFKSNVSRDAQKVERLSRDKAHSVGIYMRIYIYIYHLLIEAYARRPCPKALEKETGNGKMKSHNLCRAVGFACGEEGLRAHRKMAAS